MNLFSDQCRTYDGPIKPGQSLYQWLDASALPVADSGRVVLQSWFDAFPDELKAELCARFQNKRREQHQSALLELYLHALLSRVGYNVAPPPPFEGSKPELTATIDGSLVHFEAVTFGVEPDQIAAHDAVHALLDSIGPHISTTGYEIEVEEWTTGQKQYSARRMAQKLDALFKSDTMAGTVEDNGWKLKVAVHRTDDPNHKPQRIWRSVFNGCRSVPERERLQDALKRKAEQHRKRLEADGGLLIIAFSVMDDCTILGDTSTQMALAGSHVINVNTGRGRHIPDGLWSKTDSQDQPPSIPSAVLQVNRCDSCRLAETDVVLWLNPNVSPQTWCENWPLACRGWCHDTGMPVQRTGIAASELLGLATSK